MVYKNSPLRLMSIGDSTRPREADCMTFQAVADEQDSSLAIEIDSLTKSFGKHKALDGLQLSLKRGSIGGFLGPNGAGKSTTIRILLGLLRPDHGTSRLLGADPWHDAVALHRRIAYVPGDVELWPNLTGGQALDFLAGLRGNTSTRRRAELIERFELDISKKARTYSKGNKQKVAIVSALSADADVYILDEPATGLDPLMIRALHETVREVAAGGAAVLFSSHILSEVEQLCDSVTIVRSGRTVRAFDLGELSQLVRSTVTVRLKRSAESLAVQPYIHDFANRDDLCTFTVDPTDLDRALECLSLLGVRELSITPASLADMFLQEYQEAASEHQ
jgi:ABC-2 type transport system ATP-binding protein